MKKNELENFAVLTQTFENLPIGVGIFHIPDLNDIESIRYVFMNKVILYEMRKTKEEVFGKRIVEVAPEAYQHEGGLAVINTYFKIAAEGGSINLGLVEYSNQMVAGTYECTVHHIVDNYVYVMLRNVTELEKTRNELEISNQKLKEISTHDELTGVHNRRYLNERLSIEFTRAERHKTHLSSVILDIDFFKQINDSWGHDVGDKALKCLTTYIKKKIRKTDVFCRLGGDEFCIMFPDTSLEITAKLMKDIQLGTTQINVIHSGSEISFTCSFGVAEYQENIKSPDELLKRADTALYKAKEKGRNRVEIFEK